MNLSEIEERLRAIAKLVRDRSPRDVELADQELQRLLADVERARLLGASA